MKIQPGPRLIGRKKHNEKLMCTKVARFIAGKSVQNKHISGNRHAHLPSQLASLQLVGMSDCSGFVISAEDCQEGHKSKLVPFSGGVPQCKACLLGAERDPLAGSRLATKLPQTPCNNTFRLTFILQSQRQSVAL